MPEATAPAWETLAHYRLIEILALWEGRVMASPPALAEWINWG